MGIINRVSKVASDLSEAVFFYSEAAMRKTVTNIQIFNRRR